MAIGEDRHGYWRGQTWLLGGDRKGDRQRQLNQETIEEVTDKDN